MERSALASEVIEKAKARLKASGRSGSVCLDLLPSDQEIEKEGVEEIVQKIVDDTVYWEGGW